MFGFKSSPRNTSRPREFSTDESRVTRGSRSYTVELCPAMIVAASIALVVVLAWVFVFGIIIGRGYVPAKSEKPTSVVVVPASKLGQQSALNKGVIKPEELDFMKELKSPSNVAEPASDLSGQDAKTGPASKTGGDDSSDGQAKGTESVAKPAVAYVPELPKSVQGPVQAPKAGGFRVTQAESERKSVSAAGVNPHVTSATFPSVVRTIELRDYVYQVASYTGPGTAGKQCGKLEAGGMNARVAVEKDTQGVTRYRLYAFVRGTESDASLLRANLARLGFKSPLLVSKKVISGE